MTVSYQYDVASTTSGGFTRLLFKWKGSLYKLIYKELLLFCLAFAAMGCVYRFVFNNDQKREFEKVALYCDTYMNYIPLSFILGFYVSFVASRWWQQYMAIPWPDKLIHAIALHVTGYDEKGRMMRRTLARYINLSLVLILRSISSPLKKRFPTLDHLVEAGFMTSTELGIYRLVPNKEFNTYWVPCTWFTALLKDIKSQKRIPDPLGVKHIMEVVTIATYAFFIAAIVGRQFVEESKVLHKRKVDLYIPFFTILQFFFYMGLLKVAEQLINPFGDDDEDFELNWIIDRHMKVSYLVVDTLLLRTPPLVKDIFYDDESPVLPYTEASAEFKKRTYRGSVANMIVPEEKQNLILPDILEEGEEDRGPYTPLASLQPSLRSSTVNLGGVTKDQRSLSVPEEGVPGGGSMGSNSPRCGRRDSAKSLALSRSSSRRTGPSGIIGSSGGIGGALVAAGVHQGFLAADPEGLSLASASATPPAEESDERQSSGWCRAGSVVLDLGLESEAAPRSAPSRLAASLKARLAVRRRPVITWRPYPRPPAPAPPAVPLPEVLLEEVRAGLPAGADLQPGLVEDECAFMWRTIEEDSEPPPTFAYTWETPPEIAPPSPPRPARPPRTLRNAGSPTGARLEVPRPRLLVRRPSGSRRGRPPPYMRLRCLTCSLPMLPHRPRLRTVPSKLARTVSCPALITRRQAGRDAPLVTRHASLATPPRQDSLHLLWSPRHDFR